MTPKKKRKQMGDRASIQFRNNDTNEQSVVLCSHWGGKHFHELAWQWAKEEQQRCEKGKGDYALSTPITRHEPNTMLVKFITDNADTWTKVGMPYIGVDRSDVDDSDNGCFIIIFDQKQKLATKKGRD